MYQRVVARGGNGGNVWNDGIFEGVKKVSVGRDDYCVTYVKFKYVKDDTVESHEHGVINQTTKEFAINYPNEYITSIEGTYAYAYSSKVITSLVFKTSKGRASPSFGNERFVLANNGQKLVGFHGRSGDAIDALGAYFLSESSSSSLPKKLEAKGGPGGGTWDDGGNNDIRKVYVGRDGACVTRVMFDYVNDGETQSRAYGLLNVELEEGTYGRVHRFECTVITSLAFTTSKGRTSSTFGATKFVLEDNGRHLVGFHGISGDSLEALGAYFAL